MISKIQVRTPGKGSSRVGEHVEGLTQDYRNICRSPMAEGVFKDLIEKQGVADQWKVDSAALGPWHVGNGPDNRTMTTLRKNGITSYKHKARMLKKSDYTEFDYIFGMDDDNMSEMQDMKPQNSTAKLEFLGQYYPGKDLIIRDPYYDSRGDMDGFETVYEQCVKCCEAFLKQSS